MSGLQSVCDLNSIREKKKEEKQPTFFPRNWKAMFRQSVSHKFLNKLIIHSFQKYLYISCLTSGISVSEPGIRKCLMLLISDMEESGLHLRSMKHASTRVCGCSTYGMNSPRRQTVTSHGRTPQNYSLYTYGLL